MGLLTADAWQNALGWQQQQAALASQLNSYLGGSLWTTTGASSGTITVDYTYDGSNSVWTPTTKPVPPKRADTNVDWLRKRVDEMRVSMADFGFVQ